MVLAGRRIIDGMGARVLVLGLSFKENCTDLRNTRVVDVIEALGRYGMEAVIVDPWVDTQEAQREYGLEVFKEIPAGITFPAVIAAVAHQEFAALAAQQWQELLDPLGVLLDLKAIAPRYLQPIRI